MSKNLFEVVVVATMSAGKSTVINALIGQELLHSANEATTATITRIHDQDHLPFFSGSAYSYQNELIAESHQLDAETMKKWNADPNIKLIDIAGDIKALHNSESDIVIYDTPGPNNSQDDNHEKLTMEVINDGNFGLILYVLNATQLGVNDDRFLLEEIHKSLSKNNNKEIIFLLNKADMLDAEKGESVEKVIQHTKSYLTSIGFNTPIIIPTSASKALVCQKVLSREKITRSQLADLNIAIQDENNEFLTKPEIPAKIKLKAIAKIDRLKNKKVIFYKARNSVKISNRRLLKNYIQSGFGLVSIILQNKLSENKSWGQSKPKANYDNLKANNQKLTVKIEDHLHESKLIEKNISFIQPQYEGKSTMSNSIYIEHNPFTVQTVFKVNGETPDNISFLENIREQRLQRWIEQFFPQLSDIFNGNAHFDVTFKGVEADFLDVQEAAEIAKTQGMSIDLQWIQSENSESRLKKIQGLMEEAEKHPIFGEKIRHSQSDLRRNFNIALNKDFDVYVAATMSAGKSTLINAMLGCDLLPAANEATTATIAEITDNDATPIGQFEGKRINKNDEIVNDVQLVNLEILKEWNAKADTKLIKLTGNILGIKERENVRLVLTDTPGPNNSQDPEHSRTTMSFIQDSQRNPLILYILNGTQLGTNDDKQVLSEIARIMQQGGKQAKDRFIFVANKMDAFDPEKGESIERALGNIKKYLESNEIKNPMVYPVSALSANLLRKRESNIKLTGDERGELLKWEIKVEGDDDIRGIDFTEYMPLTKKVRNDLSSRELYNTLKETGVPAIESMIDEYIDKYNFPNRVNRAYQALSRIIEIAGNESELIKELQKCKKELGDIRVKIQALNSNRDIGVKAKAKMTSLITLDHLLPRDSIQKFDLAEAEVRQLIYDFQDEFLEDAVEFTRSQARRRLDRLTRDVTFQSNRLINNLDNILVEGQDVTRHKLTDAFNEYVKEIFNDLDIPMPILEGLKSQVSSLASLTNLGLRDNEVEVRISHERVKTGTRTESYREKVGTREVSTSKWYNPFSWGSSRSEDVYETRYKEVDVYENREKREEYVDANELWEKREAEIMRYFNNLMNDARNKLENDVLTYANSFKDFMEEEFKIKLNEIMNDLTAQLTNEEELESQAEEAKEKLKQIEEFKVKLDKVVEL